MGRELVLTAQLYPTAPRTHNTRAALGSKRDRWLHDACTDAPQGLPLTQGHVKVVVHRVNSV